MKVSVYTLEGKHLGWMRISRQEKRVDSSRVTDDGKEASEYTQEELEQFQLMKSHKFKKDE